MSATTYCVTETCIGLHGQSSIEDRNIFGFPIMKPSSFFRAFDALNLSLLTRTALIVHNNPGLFTEQIAGIVMVLTFAKLAWWLNDCFMVGKPNT